MKNWQEASNNPPKAGNIIEIKFSDENTMTGHVIKDVLIGSRIDFEEVLTNPQIDDLVENTFKWKNKILT